MGDFPDDGLELRGSRTLEVHPGPRSTLRDNAAALGWDRLESCTIEFDERGLPIRQVTRGHRSAVGRKAGSPDEMSVRTTWFPVGDRFVFRQVEIEMHVTEGGGRAAAEFPFRKLTSTWEFVDVEGIHVPASYRTRMERQDPDESGLGVRAEEVMLEGCEVNAPFAPERLRGHVPVEELGRAEEPAELLAVGTKAPDWELAAPDGTRRRLSDFRGQVVVLDFWATWCRPCLEGMPTLQRLHERFRDRGVAVLGVSCWEHQMGTERAAEPAALMKDKGLDYPLLLDGDEVADRYRVSAIPTLYLIDGDGEIRHVHLGHDDHMEETLASIIERSLG
jgi:peroxiredoxin